MDVVAHVIAVPKTIVNTVAGLVVVSACSSLLIPPVVGANSEVDEAICRIADETLSAESSRGPDGGTFFMVIALLFVGQAILWSTIDSCMSTASRSRRRH